MPEHLDSAQKALVRYKLLARPVTLQEAVQQAPAGSSGNAVSTVVTALSRLAGGVLRSHHDRHPQFLPADRGKHAHALRIALLPGASARPDIGRGAGGRDKSERLAARAAHARGRDGHVRGGRPGPSPRALFLCCGADRRRGRNNSRPWPDHRRGCSRCRVPHVSPRARPDGRDLLHRPSPARSRTSSCPRSWSGGWA